MSASKAVRNMTHSNFGGLSTSKCKHIAYKLALFKYSQKSWYTMHSAQPYSHKVDFIGFCPSVLQRSCFPPWNSPVDRLAET